MNILRTILFITVVSLLFSTDHSTYADYQILQSPDGPTVISTGSPFQSILPFTPWRHEGEEISVLVDAKVGKEGKVSDAHAVNCWVRYFCREAEMSARQWQFAPFTLASESTDVRTVILTFVFRAEVRSEDEVDSVEAVFIPPYRMEVIYRSVTPLDIILLPRIDGKIPVEKCEAHGEILKLEIMAVTYGAVAFDLKSYEEYWDARHHLFPHLNLTKHGGCVEGPEHGFNSLHTGFLIKECQHCGSVEHVFTHA